MGWPSGIFHLVLILGRYVSCIFDPDLAAAAESVTTGANIRSTRQIPVHLCWPSQGLVRTVNFVARLEGLKRNALIAFSDALEIVWDSNTQLDAA